MRCDGVDGCDQEDEDGGEVDGGTRDLGEHGGVVVVFLEMGVVGG